MASQVKPVVAGVVTRTFQSSSSSKVYTTRLVLDSGLTSCNCPGWCFKRAGKPRSCKHTLSMVA